MFPSNIIDESTTLRQEGSTTVEDSQLFFEESQSSSITVTQLWLKTLALEGPAQLALFDKLYQPSYLKKKPMSSKEFEERQTQRAMVAVDREIARLKETSEGNRAAMLGKIESIYSSKSLPSKHERDIEKRLLGPFRKDESGQVAKAFIAAVMKEHKPKPPSRPKVVRSKAVSAGRSGSANANGQASQQVAMSQAAAALDSGQMNAISKVEVNINF